MTAPHPAPGPAAGAAAAPQHAPPEHGGLDFALPPPARPTRTRVAVIGVAAVALLGAVFLLRFLPKQQAKAALAAETVEHGTATPHVQVVAPVVVKSERAVTLPGSVQPLEETVIYPRTGGYIRRWLVDIGDKVREGDLLAEIDTPDLDQRIAQARAQLAQADAGLLQAKANAIFSKANEERYRQLLPTGTVSQQDFDKAKAQADVDHASITVAETNIGAQQANLQYLGQLKTFARILAPFAGTITMRNVERGTLVTAGTGTALYKVSALDPVRVFVQVPQDVAPSVHAGIPGKVTLREYAGRVFEGKVAREAGALDMTTRTMLTEVRVPNPTGELLTGMYAQVSLDLASPHLVLGVPATALMNGADGLRVAVVDASQHIRLVPVVVERDTGPSIELSSGIQPSDQVVALPSADLTEGRLVEVQR
jgi:membrane fusion protein, multidrug efflux system